MRTLTRRTLAAVAGLAAVFALAAPAAAARADTGGYSPNSHEWYFSKWSIQQQVWPVSEGSGVTVGVVDGGVQASLPDLQGVVKPGGDMLGTGTGETDYAPNGGHGTLMAELIAGQGIGSGQYGSAPVGIAPQAKILPVHIYGPGNDISTTLPKGIKYAVDHGASVINLSVGEPAASPTDCDPQLQQAIGYALAHNAVVVAASGDTNLAGAGPEQPATCAGVLAVGGVQQSGALWQGSVQGPNVSVAAPGSHVYVTSDTGQQYSTDSNGTSGAAALTSAAAALIRSKYPSMPWYTVDQRLINTAVHVGSVPNNQTGYGIINVAEAIDVSQYPVKSSAPNPPYARYQSWLKSTGQSGSSGQTSGKSSSGGSSVLIIALVVIVVLLVAGVLIVVLLTRSRNRRGPRNPGGGTGYPPNGYTPPPGQYPQPGPYAPPGQQYPPPRQ